MDNFAEQLVSKANTPVSKRKRAALAVSGGAFSAALLLLSILQVGSGFMSIFGLILAIVSVFITIRLVQNTKVEYEYTFTNGELDIAKIIAQKRRTEMLTVDVRRLTAFGKYSDSPEEPADMTVVYVSDGDEEREYYADSLHEEYGNTRVVFVPDEKMLDNIRRSLPAKLRAEFDRNTKND